MWKRSRSASSLDRKIIDQKRRASIERSANGVRHRGDNQSSDSTNREGRQSPKASRENSQGSGSRTSGSRGRESSRKGTNDLIESTYAGTLFHATPAKPQAKEALIENTHQALRRVMICVIACGAGRVFFQFWIVTSLMLREEISTSASSALWLVPVCCIVLVRPEAFRLGSGRYFNTHGGFFLRSIFFGCAAVAAVIATFFSHHPPLWLCAVIMFLLTLSAPINDALATQASLIASGYTSGGGSPQTWRWFEDSERVMIIMSALQSYGGRLVGPLVAIILDAVFDLQVGFLVFAACCAAAGVAAGKWSSFDFRKLSTS